MRPKCGSFDEILNGRVVVLSLDALGADQALKNALVVMFLNLYYEHMLRLKKWPYQGSHPSLRRINSYLLVDEAYNIMKYEFPRLQQLLLEGREFGIGVILSSQYLSQFKQGSTNYGEALRTWFIHKNPSISKAQLQQVMPAATEGDVQRIKELGLHELLYVSHGCTGRFVAGTPFYRLGVE